MGEISSSKAISGYQRQQGGWVDINGRNVVAARSTKNNGGRGGGVGVNEFWVRYKMFCMKIEAYISAKCCRLLTKTTSFFIFFL